MSEWALNPVTGGDTRTASVSGPEHVWDVTSADNCTNPYYAEALWRAVNEYPRPWMPNPFAGTADERQIALWRRELAERKQ